MRTTANTWIWVLGVVLQGGLLGALVLSGAVRRLPWFTGLIGFYLLRAVLLFGLFGRLDPAAYDVTYATLSSLDLLLQVAVAWELLGRCVERAGRERLGIFLGLVVSSALMAWGLSLALPSSVRTPVDRGVLFASGLMLGVFLVAANRFGGGVARRVLQGFAVLGIAGVASQAGRTFAALHRDGAALMRWSWVEPLVYLGVLVFWVGVIVRSRDFPK